MLSSTVAADHNLAALHEAIAATVPERDCIIWRDRRLSWAEVTDRTRRLAAVLRDHGLGIDGSLDACAPWESPHSHVALYLHNGNEYLEGLLGAAKARTAAVNINYRYVADELRYVLRRQRRHGHPLPRRLRRHPGGGAAERPVVPPAPPGGRRLRGRRCCPGRSATRTPSGRAPPPCPPTSPRTTSTSSTPGAPPACRRGCSGAQGDFLATCLGVSETTEELLARAARSSLRNLPAPPFMHGAAHWNAISGWLAGGAVVIQDDPRRLDPVDILETARASG